MQWGAERGLLFVVFMTLHRYHIGKSLNSLLSVLCDIIIDKCVLSDIKSTVKFCLYLCICSVTDRPAYLGDGDTDQRESLHFYHPDTKSHLLVEIIGDIFSGHQNNMRDQKGRRVGFGPLKAIDREYLANVSRSVRA